jgi:hypothetical protein
VEPAAHPLSTAVDPTPTLGAGVMATAPAAIVASWTIDAPVALTELKPVFAAVTTSVRVLPESLGSGVNVAPVAVRPSMLQASVGVTSGQPDSVGVTGAPTVAVGRDTDPATSGTATVLEVNAADV